MRLLLVEDHASLSDMIADHLTRVGFVVDQVRSAEDALIATERVRYDGIILDLGLPGADGMTVLAKVREHVTVSPLVLILSARDALPERLQGLNSGADDYLIKPFDLQELEARLRAVLRRPGSRQFEEFEFGGLTLRPLAFEARIRGQAIDLARKEFVLLEELARVAPRVVVKDRLEDRLYSLHEAVTPNAIEALVSRLRKKIAFASTGVRIVTVRGIGYKLVLGSDVGMDQ